MDIGEFELIRWIRSLTFSLPKKSIVGIGDDASVIEGGEDFYYLFTTDTLVEDIHFRWEFTSPYQVGWKALAVNVSDIAAMGGWPEFSLVTLGIPKNFSFSFVKEIYLGIFDLSGKVGVEISGGDIVSSQIFFITLSLLGKVEKDKVILRKGARIGDNVYVTGKLGSAACALFFLSKKAHYKGKFPFIKRLLSPLPRLNEARKIAQEKIATSMIDISDGLLLDLSHILEESKVGAEIWQEKIPVDEDVKKICLEEGKSFLDFALGGGEDYELLFTSPFEIEKGEKLPFTVTKIGKIIEDEGIFIVDKKGVKNKVKPQGWDHFQ